MLVVIIETDVIVSIGHHLEAIMHNSYIIV